jgi:hypothetical protein
MNAGLLRRIVDVSGGAFYTGNNTHQLIDDLQRLQKTITVDMAQDIWDMPLVLVVLFGLFGMEWWLRRTKAMS